MTDAVVGNNKMVSITYSIVSENGEILEQSDSPVLYAHGGVNQMFPEVEAALEGRAVGDTIEVVLPPGKAFGERDPDLTFTDDLDNVPPEFRHIGAEVQMQNDRGETRPFIVSGIEHGKLTVDGNHPFAGKTLTYSVIINGIRDATEEEMKKGASSPVLH
ncbi:FKBP-type peptidyl-prolyl cis-trans isomerase SlyD [Thiogranum longum]|uniref:Peptidyl-prolyl cis-trans isomerase n=1 Tax=Thiogranum longum TaxID=1537524 RepID=A0A4R1HI93_9GAMM|nr:FKBP-type peptidyl-prolyl cis-trans isomerase [Thiogranum longum]TCK16922.1 FKBP-type peptidyl-prolyl cis-trans isomerase SlyD [Thiogranum longum]